MSDRFPGIELTADLLELSGLSEEITLETNWGEAFGETVLSTLPITSLSVSSHIIPLTITDHDIFCADKEVCIVFKSKAQNRLAKTKTVFVNCKISTRGFSERKNQNQNQNCSAVLIS